MIKSDKETEEHDAEKKRNIKKDKDGREKKEENYFVIKNIMPQSARVTASRESPRTCTSIHVYIHTCIRACTRVYTLYMYICVLTRRSKACLT